MKTIHCSQCTHYQSLYERNRIAFFKMAVGYCGICQTSVKQTQDACNAFKCKKTQTATLQMLDQAIDDVKVLLRIYESDPDFSEQKKV